MNPTPRKVQNSTYTSRRLDSHSQSSQSYLSEYDHLNQNEDSIQQNHLLHKKSLQLQPIPRKAHSCSLPVWSFVQPALFLLPSLSLLLVRLFFSPYFLEFLLLKLLTAHLSLSILLLF